MAEYDFTLAYQTKFFWLVIYLIILWIEPVK